MARALALGCIPSPAFEAGASAADSAADSAAGAAAASALSTDAAPEGAAGIRSSLVSRLGCRFSDTAHVPLAAAACSRRAGVVPLEGSALTPPLTPPLMLPTRLIPFSGRPLPARPPPVLCRRLARLLCPVTSCQPAPGASCPEGSGLGAPSAASPLGSALRALPEGSVLETSKPAVELVGDGSSPATLDSAGSDAAAPCASRAAFSRGRRLYSLLAAGA